MPLVLARSSSFIAGKVEIARSRPRVLSSRQEEKNNTLLKPGDKASRQGGTETAGMDLRQCRSAVKIRTRKGRSIAREKIPKRTGKGRKSHRSKNRPCGSVVRSLARSLARLSQDESSRNFLRGEFLSPSDKPEFYGRVAEEFENTISPGGRSSRDNL